MAIVASIVIASGMWWDPRYQLVLLLLVIIPVYISKLPLYWFTVVAVAVVTSLYPVTMTSIGQTNPEIFKVLDRTWASTPVLVGDVPLIGRLGITYGGLMWLLAAEMRSIIMATYMFVFIYTTSMAEVTDTLLALKVPQPAVFVISIAYKLIPYLSRVVDHILSAQRLRGWSLRYWNPVKIVRRAAPLMKPLMRRVAITTEQITLASQIRGFGSGQVTPTRKLTLTTLDYVLIVIAILFTITVLILTAFFNVGLL